MEAIKIVINSIEDAENGKGIMKEDILPDLSNLKETKDLTIGILEKGTRGGQTTLMFCLKNEDGTISMAQCTGNQFEMLIGAFRGAVERFENNK